MVRGKVYAVDGSGLGDELRLVALVCVSHSPDHRGVATLKMLPPNPYLQMSALEYVP